MSTDLASPNMFKLFSDIHLEHGGDVEYAQYTQYSSDMLILAGDICCAKHIKRDGYGKVYRDFFKIMGDNHAHVLYVLGNHEHYGCLDLTQTADRIRPYLPNNVHLLDNQSVFINGVNYVGSTLWTDYNNREPLTMWNANQKMTDFKKIRLRGERAFPEDFVLEFDKSVRFIKSEVSKGLDTVVITHHAPSFQSVHPQYKRDYNTNGAYASCLDNLILEYPNIKTWCHGHMHNSCDYLLGSTRVICNPRGYPMWKNEEFTFEEFK